GRELKHLLTSGLTEAGDLAAAERSAVTALAWARDVGDPASLSFVLHQLARLDLRAGRLADTAQHVRESLQIAARTGHPLTAPHRGGRRARAYGAHGRGLGGFLVPARGRGGRGGRGWGGARRAPGAVGVSRSVEGCARRGRAATRRPAGARGGRGAGGGGPR